MKKKTSRQKKPRLEMDDSVSAIVDLDVPGFTRCIETHYREALHLHDTGQMRGTTSYQSSSKWGFGRSVLVMVTDLTKHRTRCHLE